MRLHRNVKLVLSDKRGSVNILFAFSLIPMIGLVGLSIDYGVGQAEKSKLDNAADSAAVAAVATAKAYVAANASDSNLTADAITAGKNRALRAFSVNAGALAFATVPAPVVNLTRTGQTFASTVTYATTSTNHFGQIFGSPTLKISGTAAATADIPSYLDFYLLIDVSGSMGLPSTSDGQAALAKVNTQSPDPFPNASQGCQFACHFPGYHGWTLATNNNIQLRSGAVNSAVCGLLSKAGQPLVANQYRVGLYPFITQMGTLAALSSSLTNANTQATCSSQPPTKFTALLDTGQTQEYTNNDPTTGIGSGGTHFETVIPAMQSVISSGAGFGDGSASNKSRPFVFLITDGMDNGQYFSYQSNGRNYYDGSTNPPSSPFQNYSQSGFNGGSTPQPITASQCSSLKSQGATISILYIPYTPISYDPNNSNTDPYGEIAKADNAAPNLPAALTSCASDGFFYTANSPADITNSLNAMFQQAIQVAHITQ